MLTDESISDFNVSLKDALLAAMRGNGYARVDLRVRPDCEIVILEIDPNCGIPYYGPDDQSYTDLMGPGCSRGLFGQDISCGHQMAEHEGNEAQKSHRLIPCGISA